MRMEMLRLTMNTVSKTAFKNSLETYSTPSSSYNRPLKKTSISVSQILNVSSLHTPAHLKDSNHSLEIMGELKTPWIGEHQMKRRIVNERLLREILAQPIMYMKDLGCIYGFLSIYEETIFLLQVVDNNGV